MKYFTFILIITFLACSNTNKHQTVNSGKPQEELSILDTNLKKVVKTVSQWQKILTENQFYVLREKGTERPYSNEFHDSKTKGNYFCAGCKLPLFYSSSKFDSGTGWPSFFSPIKKNRVINKSEENSRDLRIEVTCARCDGHLGHVFDDGPMPTGLRYCMNSAALLFKPTN